MVLHPTVVCRFRPTLGLQVLTQKHLGFMTCGGEHARQYAMVVGLSRLLESPQVAQHTLQEASLVADRVHCYRTSITPNRTTWLLRIPAASGPTGPNASLPLTWKAALAITIRTIKTR